MKRSVLHRRKRTKSMQYHDSSNEKKPVVLICFMIRKKLLDRKEHMNQINIDHDERYVARTINHRLFRICF